MRVPVVVAALGACALVGCGGQGDGDAEVRRAMRDVAEVDDGGLTEMMMSVADPAEAVAYFSRQSEADPTSVEDRRGLAEALIRAGRGTEGAAAWGQVVAMPGATDDDRVDYAGALIRVNDWDGARAALAAVPPTHETYERYRYEAMVADAAEDWARSDSYYETAVGLTTTPAGVLNNWGFSKLTRGDYPAAERLFTDALRHDPTMFTAKNNLIMARGAQRNYDLPVIPMTQEERAELLYTLALTAIKQNDLTIGRGLLQEAVDSHPRHFDEAARALEAMNG